MKRCLILIFILISLTGAVHADGTPPSSGKKYPPYPDVWHRKIPEPREVYPNALDYGLAPGGDIVVEYARVPVKRPEDFDLSNGIVYFFSGKHLPIVSMEAIWKHTNPAYPKMKIKLANGSTVEYGIIDYSPHPRCPQQLEHYFVITDASGKVTRKSLIYILDKPQHHDIQILCEDSHEGAFYAKVVAISAEFVPLEDGGFLVGDGEGGVVIRFDANLQTRTPLLNRQLFWMDTRDIQQLEKNLRDQHGGSLNYQAMHDAILARLRAKQEVEQ